MRRDYDAALLLRDRMRATLLPYPIHSDGILPLSQHPSGTCTSLRNQAQSVPSSTESSVLASVRRPAELGQSFVLVLQYGPPKMGLPRSYHTRKGGEEI